MEVTQQFFDSVLKLVEKYNGSDNYELEGKYKNGVTREQFYKILQYFMSVSDAETLNQEILDITFEYEGTSYRVSIVGKQNVAEYCKTNLLPDPKEISVMTKSKIEGIKYSDFGFNIDLSQEKQVSSPKKEDILQVVHSLKKGFRYKKRYSIIDEDYLRYDMTVVKESTYKGSYVCHDNFAHSGVTSNPEKYEVEIEFVEKKKNISKATEGFISSIIQVYSVLHEEEHVVSEQEKEIVIKSYLEKYRQDKKRPLTVIFNRAKLQPQEYFVGPQPITLEMKNLVPDVLGNTCVLQDYTVTEKADGERFNLYINDVGKCYLVNNRLSVKYMGVQLNNTKNTLLDGEYITKDILGRSINMYAIFDVYYFEDSFVADKPLVEGRDKLMSDFAKKHEQAFKAAGITMVAKQFRHGEDILKECKDILDNEKLKTYPYKIDGLVFTPKTFGVGGYFKTDPGNLYGTWHLVMKWKPPKDNTIDFLAEYQRGDKAAHAIRFIDSKSFKILNLYVGYNPAQWEPISARSFLENRLSSTNNEYVKKLFLPGDVGPAFSQCYVEMKKEFNGRGACLDGSEIEDGCILECKYENNAWVPLRVRADKTEKYKKSKSLSRAANDYGSALNVWRSITSPVTEVIISGKEPVPTSGVVLQDDVYYFRMIDRDKMASKKMLDFHNYWVKSYLIKKFKGKESIMDIACGKAGDLLKWKEAQFSKILGIDYNRDNIENPKNGAYARLVKLMKENSMNGIKHVFLTMDGGEKITSESISALPNENDRYVGQAVWAGEDPKNSLSPYVNYIKDGFDVVSCQFAAHYFFESEEKLDNFVFNVNKHLKNGGYFVGTCLNGTEIKKLFRKKKVNEHVTGKLGDRVLWDICRRYENSSDSIDYGEKIDIYMESIGRVATEYLVDIDKLVEKFKKFGIVIPTGEDLEKIKLDSAIGSFKDMYSRAISTEPTLENAYYLNSAISMSEQEKSYSFMNMYFVFVKKQDITVPAKRVVKRKIVIKRED